MCNECCSVAFQLSSWQLSRFMPGPESSAEWHRERWWSWEGGEGWGFHQHAGSGRWEVRGCLYPEEHLNWGETHHLDWKEWRIFRGVFSPRPTETSRGESITGPERGTAWWVIDISSIYLILPHIFTVCILISHSFCICV